MQSCKKLTLAPLEHHNILRRKHKKEYVMGTVMTTSACPVCGNKCTKLDHPNDSGNIEISIECERCGEYNISEKIMIDLVDFINISTNRKKADISSFLKENQVFTINTNSFELIKNTKTPPITYKVNRLIKIMEEKSEHIGQIIEIISADKEIQSETWSINEQEVNELVQYMVDKKLISDKQLKILPIRVSCKLSVEGWSYIEELSKKDLKSTQGFVAMWFDASMTPIYDSIIAPAISQTGYNPHRVDRREHAGKVDDEIIAQIRRSKFVVADFTDHRGGVYYEAGFAHGLGLPVIMACREDHLDKLHFDIRQYNCILWNQENLVDFQERLKNRIEAILGRGPLIHEA